MKVICLKECTDSFTSKTYKEGEVIELPLDRAEKAIEIGAVKEYKEKTMKG